MRRIDEGIVEDAAAAERVAELEHDVGKLQNELVTIKARAHGAEARADALERQLFSGKAPDDTERTNRLEELLKENAELRVIAQNALEATPRAASDEREVLRLRRFEQQSATYTKSLEDELERSRKVSDVALTSSTTTDALAIGREAVRALHLAAYRQRRAFGAALICGLATATVAHRRPRGATRPRVTRCDGDHGRA